MNKIVMLAICDLMKSEILGRIISYNYYLLRQSNLSGSFFQEVHGAHAIDVRASLSRVLYTHSFMQPQTVYQLILIAGRLLKLHFERFKNCNEETLIKYSIQLESTIDFHLYIILY